VVEDEQPLNVSAEIKERIDSMSRYDMARRWRVSALGDELLQGDSGLYFARRFNSLGGFNAAISKQLGW
jgi:hypothetical protein